MVVRVCSSGATGTPLRRTAQDPHAQEAGSSRDWRRSRKGFAPMTDRMTERFDTPETPGSSNADAPLYGATDLEGSGRSETVTSSAAVDELSLGQGTGSGSSGDAGAKDHAQAVAQDAKESTKGVASTAASEAKDVAREAKTQLRQLLDQLGGEATQQASGQTQRAVQG